MVHAFRARTTVRRRVAVRRRLHRRFVTEIRITNAEGFDRAAQGADLAVVIARADIEMLLGTRVFLDLWVKVKKDWRDRDSVLRGFGFGNEQ